MTRIMIGNLCVRKARVSVAGFTLIELLVVMSIISTLLMIAVPYYFHNIQKSKEAVLRQDLTQMREALDKYYGDHEQYPETLDDLVTSKYLRRIPVDPVTDSVATWVVVPPDDASKGGVYDVHSGADGTGLDDTPYAEW